VRRTPATLTTIAERAGVHASTVSRALSTTPSGIAPATAQRVRAIADELGYLPDPTAAALRTRRSHVIGVLVPRLTDIVLAVIYEGIDDVALQSGYQTVVANTRDDLALQRTRLETLLARRVDGLILGDARSDTSLIDDLAERGIPYVLTSRRLRGHLSVTTDDLCGGRLAAEHLLSLGHVRLGVIAGEPYASTGVDRTRGFLDACLAAGVDIEASRVVHTTFDAAGGRDGAEQLLRLRPRPTALFAVNDFAAIGAMGAVRAAGLEVGRDIAIVGYNDVSIATDLPVPLTTIRSPMFQMGQEAARMLLERVAGRPVNSQLLTPELVARASTLLGP